ncbi:MAG: hypothetical protein OES47_11795 [Acidobacteriota bacterium]|nr:hypothetical protein [Acidobacteriota bacterium]
MPSRSVRAGLIAAVALTLALPALGDDVFLENGRSFESVIVVAETEDTVRIRLPYGEMSLPKSWVDRVVREQTPLEEFLQRRSLLLRKFDAGVTDWLDLAVWARAHELEHGYRESVLAAAEIDPGSESLSTHMRRLGRVFDKELDRWILYEESQRRAGLEQHEGKWVPRQEAERERQRERQARVTTEERLGRAIEALAVAQLERETRETEQSRATFSEHTPPTVYHVPLRQAAVYPTVVFPAGFVRLPSAGDGDTDEETSKDGEQNRGAYDSLRRRQPGSLLVSRSGSRSVGALAGIRRQPGSLALNP